MRKTTCLVALLTLATLCSTQPDDKRRHEAGFLTLEILHEYCRKMPDSNFCIEKMKRNLQPSAVQPKAFNPRHVSPASRR
ncbi:hypothetical protein C0Q70_00401 [Pomacea canaliculata]|uniref:Uncharacterized protein n=1 Tax=Pomacea canaliculata TaxID=400727 RepID=A0A2T7PWK4_POMCA|nr:hypothetical protein C0Q70_00401 [Pomacea canaliculata]